MVPPCASAGGLRYLLHFFIKGFLLINNLEEGTREKALQLRAVTALPEDAFGSQNYAG